MREATKVTPSKLDFYDKIFNWKKDTGQRIVNTREGIKILPRKVKIGGLSRGTKSMTRFDVDEILPIRDEKITSISIIKSNARKLKQALRNNAYILSRSVSPTNKYGHVKRQEINPFFVDEAAVDPKREKNQILTQKIEGLDLTKRDIQRLSQFCPIIENSSD